MKCEHNWVRSGYGNDLICTKCGYAAMQATINPVINPFINTNIELSEIINTKPAIKKEFLTCQKIQQKNG